MRIYSAARSITSSGLPIILSSGLAKITPMAATNTLENSARVMAVCTARLTAAWSRAPQRCATTTLAPTLMPMNTFTSRLIRDEVEPTAASA